MAFRSVFRKTAHFLSDHSKMSSRNYTQWPYLKEEHVMIAQTCRTFAENELKPMAARIDRERLFPEQHVKKLAELGMMGVNVSTEYGGAGMDALAYAIVLEELARGCTSTAVVLSANSLFTSAVEGYGNLEQKKMFLTPCASGDVLGCFMLSEPGNGSDAGAASTSAKQDGDHWILNGTKAWITNSYQAKYGVVFVTTDRSLRHKGISAFIVDMKAPGIVLGKKEDKLGIRGTTTATVTFEDYRVPASQMMGQAGSGFSTAMNTMNSGRVVVGSQAIGCAQAALDCAVEYSKVRKSFDKPICSLYAIQEKLSKMSVKIDAARLLVHKAAMLKDAGLPYIKDAAQAKLFASEAATFCAHQCIQVLGGMGYVSDMPAERFYRDARITEIYDGTSEIQHMVIAGQVLKGF